MVNSRTYICKVVLRVESRVVSLVLSSDTLQATASADAEQSTLTYMTFLAAVGVSCIFHLHTTQLGTCRYMSNNYMY